MTRQNPGGPLRKSVERRQEILEAAYQLFEERGDRATLRDIAARVGVTQPALVYYFPTREDLLIAVMEHRDALGRTMARQAAPDMTLDAAVRMTTEHPALAKLFVAVTAASMQEGSASREYLAQRYRRLAEETAAGLAKAQREGTVTADVRAEDLARLLLAVLAGLQIQWINDPSVDMSALLETFGRLYRTPIGEAHAEPTG